MAKFEVHLAPKPGTIGGNVQTIVEANDPFQAKQLAQAQYGSGYRVIAHYSA